MLCVGRRKKKVTDQSVNGGGGKPLAVTKIDVLKKRK